MVGCPPHVLFILLNDLDLEEELEDLDPVKIFAELFSSVYDAPRKRHVFDIDSEEKNLYLDEVIEYIDCSPHSKIRSQIVSILNPSSSLHLLATMMQ